MAAMDEAGNLSAVKDEREVSPPPAGGIITTVAGSGAAGFSGDGGQATQAQLNNPYGVAVDRAGNLFIADTLNNSIRKVTAP